MFKYLLKTVQFYRNLELIKAELRRQTHAQLNYAKKLGADLTSIAIWTAIAAALACFAVPVLLILIFAIISQYVGTMWALVILLSTLSVGALIGMSVVKAKIAAIKKPPSLKMLDLKDLSGGTFSANDYLIHPNLGWLVLAAKTPGRRKMDRQSQAILRQLKPKAEALADAAAYEIVDRLQNGDPKMKAEILGSAVIAGWFASQNVKRPGTRKSRQVARKRPVSVVPAASIGDLDTTAPH